MEKLTYKACLIGFYVTMAGEGDEELGTGQNFQGDLGYVKCFGL